MIHRFVNILFDASVVNWSLVAATLALSSQAQAETLETQPQDSIVVLGSRLPVDAPNVETIERTEIEARRPRGIGDLLLNVPGVSVSQQGGTGRTEIFLRNAESNFTTILIDGVKVNNPSNTRGGSFDFSTLVIGQVERVDLIQGPVSSIYGSDGIAGAISITTREVKGGEVEVSSGTAGQYSGRLASGASLTDNISMSVSVAHQQVDALVTGYAHEATSTQLQSRYKTAQISGYARVNYTISDETRFPDASGGPQFAINRELETIDAADFSAAARVTTVLDDRTSINISGNYYKRSESSNTPSVADGVFGGIPASISDLKHQRAEFQAAATRRLNDALDLVVGSEITFERGQRGAILDLGFALVPANFDLDRTSYAGFVEASYVSPFGMELFASGRYDDIEQVGDVFTFRSSVAYTLPASGARLHLSWGDGFKAPSFFALGDSLVGNPALLSETVETVEAGLDVPIGNWSAVLSAKAYRSDFRNLIDFDFATFSLVNLSNVRIQGGELSAKFKPTSKLNSRVYIAYSDIETQSGDGLLLRPKWTGGGYIHYRMTKLLDAAVTVNVVGSRAAASAPTGLIDLDGYQRVDLSINYQIVPRIKLYFAADNILDAAYFDEAGVPAAGINARIGLTARF